MSTLKSVKKKKNQKTKKRTWLRDIPETELLPDGRGEGGLKDMLCWFSKKSHS